MLCWVVFRLSNIFVSITSIFPFQICTDPLLCVVFSPCRYIIKLVVGKILNTVIMCLLSNSWIFDDLFLFVFLNILHSSYSWCLCFCFCVWLSLDISLDIFSTANEVSSPSECIGTCKKYWPWTSLDQFHGLRFPALSKQNSVRRQSSISQSPSVGALWDSSMLWERQVSWTHCFQLVYALNSVSLLSGKFKFPKICVCPQGKSRFRINLFLWISFSLSYFFTLL